MTPEPTRGQPTTLLQRLQRRGVLRVGFSYAVIAWLLLQIGDVVMEPIGAPGWVMRILIVVVVAGFPIALLLAWSRQALDDLEGAIDAGWTNLWWTLDLLDADPEFAAVTADPRFREITGRLHDRITAMRESYFANPELLEGYTIH